MEYCPYSMSKCVCELIGKQMKENNVDLHIGSKLYKPAPFHNDELGHFVKISEGEIEGIEVNGGKLRFSVRWDFGACQMFSFDYIGKRAFIKKDDAIRKMMEFDRS